MTIQKTLLKNKSIETPSKGCSSAKVQNCIFLGSKIPPKIHLELKEVVHEWVFSVHDSTNGNIYGYLINMVTGISGPDFDRFHSDEGYYEVGVVRNAKRNPVDFIALLGNQNELNWYDLDRLKGRVDIYDIFWFDKHAKKYYDACEMGPDSYPNNKFCGSSSSGSIDPGVYAIIPAKLEKGVLFRGLKNGGIYSCKGESGVDSFGRKYRFPHRAFKFVKLTKSADLERYESHHTNAPNGGHYSVSGAGNVTI